METSAFFVASTWILPVIFAVTLHEAAHGWMAERFGDDTARKLGRVTFNPLKHIDPMGTVIIPALLLLVSSPILFGYAKPVPVDFTRLQPPRRGMFFVAIAGVVMNILLALACGLLLNFAALPEQGTISWGERNLINGLMINCALALFNMIPLLPLDGGRALRALLPGKAGEAYASTERYGFIGLIIVLLLPPLFGYTMILDTLMEGIKGLMGVILMLTGHASA